MKENAIDAISLGCAICPDKICRDVIGQPGRSMRVLEPTQDFRRQLYVRERVEECLLRINHIKRVRQNFKAKRTND